MQRYDHSGSVAAARHEPKMNSLVEWNTNQFRRKGERSGRESRKMSFVLPFSSEIRFSRHRPWFLVPRIPGGIPARNLQNSKDPSQILIVGTSRGTRNPYCLVPLNPQVRIKTSPTVFIKYNINCINFLSSVPDRGRSSNGRAAALHAAGSGIDAHRLQLFGKPPYHRLPISD